MVVSSPHTQDIKIELIAKTPFFGSGPRGIDVYARLLGAELSRIHPLTHIQLSRDRSVASNPDLVHYTFFDLFFTTLWGHTPQCPFAVTIHDVIPLRFPAHFPFGLRGKFKLWLQKRALSHASAVITDSASSKRDIQTYLNIQPDKIHVIPLAAGHRQATIALTKTVKQEYGLPDRFILYVGDINWNKNIPGLIKAFASLPSRRTHLVLVGKAFVTDQTSPESRAIKDAIAQSGKSELIHTLGFVPGHHLGALYRLATLYVQPSWYEGFGFPILEALTQGTPVLSSNQGSLPEVGGEYVHYFDPHDDKSFADSLHELLAHPARRSIFIESGRRWASQFTWSKVAAATYAIYAQILAAHS